MISQDLEQPLRDGQPADEFIREQDARAVAGTRLRGDCLPWNVC